MNSKIDLLADMQSDLTEGQKLERPYILYFLAKTIFFFFICKLDSPITVGLGTVRIYKSKLMKSDYHMPNNKIKLENRYNEV